MERGQLLSERDRGRRKTVSEVPITAAGPRNSVDYSIIPEFKGAVFVAALKDMRFLPTGSLELKFIVQHDDRDGALQLKDAFGLELRFDLSRKEYGNADPA